MMLTLSYAFHRTIKPIPTLFTCFSSSSSSSSSSSNDGTQQRLERIISNRGIGSRLEVSKLFRQGRVTINGKVILSGKNKYPLDVVVEIDGEKSYNIPLLAKYYKPLGVLSVMADNYGRENLADLVVEYPFLKSMHPVGRLDADTTGLLLFSSDGHLTQTLLNPSSEIEREYEALVVGHVNSTVLSEQLNNGIKTTEGVFKGALLHSSIESDVPYDSIAKQLDLNDTTTAVHRPGSMVPTSSVRLTVTEGKYRMVRRILHNAGHSVIALHRRRYGNILLNKNELAEGEVTPISEAETEWAKKWLKKRA